MKFTHKQLERILFDRNIEADGKTIELVEESEWVHGGKEEEKRIIFTDGEKFYMGYVGRFYSTYLRDYTYYSEYLSHSPINEHVVEVKKKKKVIETFE
jgi:hypothetical protein